MIVIREPRDDELEMMFYARWEVLRKPHALPLASERDEKDNHSRFVIAIDEESGKIVGSGCYTLEADGACELDCLGVYPKYRGRGIGTQLFEFRRDRARELGASHLYIIARKTSVPFHQKMGYVIDGDYHIHGPTKTLHVRMTYRWE